MHWVLDMIFGENQSHVRVENTAQSFVSLCRIALNLLKCDTNTCAGLKMRRLKVRANDQSRHRLIGV
ncbi:hypothetical protein PQR67_10370 [Paraburkholderia fungorum]|uniref:hypothetical protein n=1 Tax=Paraburkholderia fungorum TaxID=134537 RepID=UPI0038BA3378